MKHTFITTALAAMALTATSLTASAQLKVTSNGTVYIKGDSIYGRTCANIGKRQSGMTDLDNVYYYTGLRSFAYNELPTGHTIGVFGEPKLSNPSQHYSGVGVWGVGGSAVSGRNIGVYATLHTGSTGAALFAANQDLNFFTITGNYAGFFYGDLRVEGLAYSTVGFYGPSDMRLKRNIVKMADKEEETGSTLGNLMGLEVMEYDLCTPLQNTISEMPDSLKPTGKNPNPDIRHYGVSAQELQKLYPDLVMEGEDGYLSVNYTGLVPLLLRSIQELKAELDEVKGKEGHNGSLARTSRTDHSDVTTDARADSRVSKTQAVLYQNTPNPFTARTEIRFSLPDDAPQACIYIFDMNGRMQKQIPVDPSQRSVTVAGYELQPGIYLYSLVVGGQEIDTKRMILSK